MLIVSQDIEDVVIFDLDKREKVGRFKGHSYPPTSCCFKQSNMSRAISFSKHEFIYWRVCKDEDGIMCLKQDFMYPAGTCKPVLSTGQNLVGIIQNNKLRLWTH